ncbi:Auxin Efflux Carrier [Pseudoalteromonas luteoviolacea B = ATCC 29581]|nr:Auxin Efflux Carrier [Pseudoalteromonas luteoviolacea B = ATCC 29581]
MYALTTILPIACIVFFGFFCTKRDWLNQSQLDGVRHFVFNLIMPVFLFTHMIKADLHSQFELNTMLAFYLPVLATFIGVYLLAQFAAKMRKDEAATFALGTTYSNTVLVALPVILFHLGEHAAAMVFVIITFHSAALFALTFILAKDPSSGKRMVVKSLINNPIVASISLGLLVNILFPPLPSLLLETLSLAGQPALAGALFVLGASLNYYRIGKLWRKALLISVAKLVLLPCLVYSLARYWFELDPIHIRVVTLMSAAPLGVNAYLIAKQLNVLQAELAGGVILSTTLSAITLSIWLTYLS